MVELNLIHVHIGNTLPAYIFDSIYQTILINASNCKIYIILSDSLIPLLKETISKFNLNIYFKTSLSFENLINIIPISLLDKCDNLYLSQYKEIVLKKWNQENKFRDGFWISTTSRFFYIYTLVKLFDLKNVFHIENDIMLYQSFVDIYDSLQCYDKITMVQDSPRRVIPSILYIPNENTLSLLLQFINNTLSNSLTFLNDMTLLGLYKTKNDFNEIDEFVFDGAAIGQFLGGVDPRNLPEYNSNSLELEYNNPSKGFVNETSVIKASDYTFRKIKMYSEHLSVPINYYIQEQNIQISEDCINYKWLVNLHIHSKQLYEFSSIRRINYLDIISGDRVIGLCDFVITTREIYNFHKNITDFINVENIIIVKDFDNVNFTAINLIFKHLLLKNGDDYPIRLFVYTHILTPFQDKILPFLDNSLKFVLYTHNSDHPFDASYIPLLESHKIKYVFAQNIDYPTLHSKLCYLPIGIANSMWTHGDLLKLFTEMKNSYMFDKTKNIYVNINPNTYSYRKVLLDKFKENNCFTLSSNKEYSEYLKELAQHRFCLCIRGNGLSCHRSLETLYLGCIPVFINNKTTQMDNHINYFRQLDLPFVEIKDDDLDLMCEKWNDSVFDEDLYKKLIIQCKNSIYNLDALKISHYTYKDDL